MDTGSDDEVVVMKVRKGTAKRMRGALFTAVKGRDFDTVAGLVVDGVDLGEKDECWRTALHVAVKLPSASLVVTLTSNGAPVDAEDFWGNPPLLYACEAMNVPVIKALVKAGAKYHQGALSGVLAFGLKCMVGDERDRYISALQMVVKLGRSANADIGEGNPLAKVNDREAMDILAWGGVDIDQKGTWDQTPLSRYLESEYNKDLDFQEPVREMVEGFLLLGADPNSVDDVGDSPLMNYVGGWSTWRSTKLEIVDLLLRAGADETIVNFDGDDAVSIVKTAIGFGHDTGSMRAILRLLSTAPEDRRWRRRAIIPMCIARHNRDYVPTRPIVVSGDDPWTNWAACLLRMGSDGGANVIYRTIVGYL